MDHKEALIQIFAEDNHAPRKQDAALIAIRAMHAGKTQTEAAEIAGVSQATISTWKRSAWWKRAEAFLRTEQTEQIVSRAMTVILKNLSGEDPDLVTARWAVNTLADRGPLDKAKDESKQDPLEQLTPDELRALARLQQDHPQLAAKVAAGEVRVLANDGQPVIDVDEE